ncbi:hypothetical protein [Marinobacterium sedimentorum]|uniref:hypothetical protein n=1 Tax=Marinobacterium sedimentorum TaxID=2927804 RepID=UPI0020C6F1C3|nr:hypothetical protein [Marinobacterium sedimentorum]MCP8685953.1 hypothetical protein [Marinobacterium sedimentorum]
MKEKTKYNINLKAHFVGGSDGYFRPENDPTAQSAIDDAIAFIESLPEKYQEPDIYAGSTNDPTRIVSVGWSDFSAGMFGVNILFKGNENFVVRWSNPDRTRSSKTVSSMDELKNMNIPQMIENLKNIRPPMPGERPLG